MDNERASIAEILQRMEDVLENGRTPAFGKSGSVLVDRTEFMDYISEIQNNLPEQIAQAERINNNCTKIIANAQNTAKNIIDDAKAQARALVNENEITRLAQAEAERIMDEANLDARQVRAGATAFTREILQTCEDTLNNVLRLNINESAEAQNFLSNEISILQTSRMALGDVPADEEAEGYDDGVYYDDEDDYPEE